MTEAGSSLVIPIDRPSPDEQATDSQITFRALPGTILCSALSEIPCRQHQQPSALSRCSYRQCPHRSGTGGLAVL